MTTEEAFLAQIAANPGDVGLLRIYADWLDEQGRPIAAEARRLDAEFTEIAGIYGSGGQYHQHKDRIAAILDREADLVPLLAIEVKRHSGDSDGEDERP